MSATPDAPELTFTDCAHCGVNVPAGPYCGNCGAHLSEAGTTGRSRSFAYAAAPHEPVTRPSVITTLFPHLPHRHTHAFRDLLVAGVVIVGILAAFRLYSSATIAAALILPILYLLYLYEAEVYEREPVLVIAATFIAGAALGVAYALLAGHFVRPSLRPSVGSVLVYGVVYPIIAQLLMLVGPLLLLGRRHFDETLDGLSFGAASALGFTMALVIAGYWHTLTTTLVGTAPAVDEVLNILRIGVLAAIVNASTTALVTSALWLHTHGRRRGARHAVWHTIAGALVTALLVQVVLGVLTSALTQLVGVVVIWIAGAVLSLVLLRLLVHAALLDEGVEHSVGALAPCPECHRLVPVMRFCPACGVARSAAPKRGAFSSNTTTTDTAVAGAST